MGIIRQLLKISTRTNQFVELVFQKYGCFVYKNSYLVLTLSMILLVSLAYGFFLYEEELDESKLWVPEEAQAFTDLDKLREAYGQSPNKAEVYVTAKDNGRNVLTEEAFSELIEYELGFWKTVSKDGVYYKDICIKADNAGACLLYTSDAADE